jgi:type II secretory pathway pseudopilin PulG
LVELMVVVAIMAVLAALVAGVVIKATEAQKNANTETTIKVLKSALSRQLQTVIDEQKKKDPSKEAITYRVASVFPQSLAAITGTNGYGPYKRDLATKNVLTTSGTLSSDLQAYFLWLIIEKGPMSKLESDMLPKGALGKKNISGTDIDLFTDAWGDPISLEIATVGSNLDKLEFRFTTPNMSGVIRD